MLEHLPEGVKRCSGPGFNNYKLCDHLFASDDECLASVYHGGHNPHPNVKASGGDADRRHGDVLAGILRHEFPDHKVSRLDPAFDVRGDGLFDRIDALATDVWREQRALGRRFKDQRIGGSAPEDGRTIYLGSRKSNLCMRAYEKGKERYAATGDPFWLDYSDLVRLELQVRPQKAFKRTAATIGPKEAWGCSPWSRRVMQGVAGMSPEPISLKIPRVSDHERAMRWLTAQGGRTILHQVEILGSWEAFTLDLQRRLGVVADEESPQAA
jgi:hypothetical protein